jgi:hypothetical protein
MMERAVRGRDRFVWDVIRSPEELGRVRMAAMNDFLSDYDPGRRSGRYMAASLPHLPFGDGAFELALCSHFLFLYSDELSTADHAEAVLELCRVAREVRVFPLLEMNGERSRHVGPVLEASERHGPRVRVERVEYEFQRGGNEMMVVQRNVAQFPFSDLQSFKDYIVFVQTYLPDRFRPREGVGPADQWTLSLAFEGLRRGIAVADAEGVSADVLRQCRGELDAALESYVAGNSRDGFFALERLSTILKRIPPR